MNNKGQTMGIAIISAIFIFIVGMMIINFIMDEVTTARANLNCASASTISDGNKLLCLVIDTTVFYWIILVFSVLTGVIVSRMTL